MLEINKREFFQELSTGDIQGLENLNKQLREMYLTICENLKANTENGNIKNMSVAEILCEMQENVVKQQTLLKFVIDLNYIFVETEQTKYASKYYDLAEKLYHNAFSDLLNMLNITEQDFEEYGF